MTQSSKTVSRESPDGSSLSTRLLEQLRERLQTERYTNLGLILLSPILFSFIVLFSLYSEVIRSSFAPLLVSFLVIGFLFLIDRFALLFQKVALVDGARILDRTLESEDRFLTLASLQLERSDPRYQLLLHQAEFQATEISAKKVTPLNLQRSARLSLFIAPALLLVALLIFAPVSGEKKAEQLAFKRKEIDESVKSIRELTETPNQLPADVLDNLAMVAEALEEKGEFDIETLELIDSSIKTIEHIESIKLDKEAPPPNEKKEPEEKSEQQQQTSESNNSETGEPEAAKQKKSLSEQSEEQNQDKSKSGKSEQNKKSDSGEKGAGDEQQSAGQSKSGESQTKEAEQANESGQGQKGSQKGSAGQDDKKSETGVGEGKGKGKSGEGGTKDGKDQTGQDDTGAKEGNAQNKSTAGGGKSEGTSSDKSQEANGSSQAGKGQEGKQGKESGEQASGRQLNKAKDVLSEIKEKNEAAAGKGKAPSESGEQEKGEQGKESQGKTQLKPGTEEKHEGQKSESKDQSSESQKQSEQGSGKDQKPGKDEGGEKGKGMTKSQKPEVGKENGAGEKGGPIGDNPNPDKQAPEGNRDATVKPSKNNQPSAGSNSPEAKELPQSGDGDGKGGGSNPQAGMDLAITESEQVTAKHLGGEEKKMYRYGGGAKAGTTISEGDFEKPKAEVGKSSQPIPVEYQDLLNE